MLQRNTKAAPGSFFWAGTKADAIVVTSAAGFWSTLVRPSGTSVSLTSYPTALQISNKIKSKGIDRHSTHSWDFSYRFFIITFNAWLQIKVHSSDWPGAGTKRQLPRLSRPEGSWRQTARNYIFPFHIPAETFEQLAGMYLYVQLQTSRASLGMASNSFGTSCKHHFPVAANSNHSSKQLLLWLCCPSGTDIYGHYIVQLADQLIRWLQPKCVEIDEEVTVSFHLRIECDNGQSK